MRTLKQILEDAAAHASGTYVALEMSPQSKQQLGDFVKNTLKLKDCDDPASYHITVIASSTPLPQAEELKVTSVQAQPDYYELFNTRAGTRCLVLKIKSSQAENLNRIMIKQGGKSAFPDYNPHVTLCFDYTSETPINQLPIPKFPLTFDHLLVKPNDPLWRPPKA